MEKGKNIEQKLKESEDRYRVLTESMLDGILIIDFTGKVLFANYMALQMFGFKNLEDVLGSTIFDFVVPKYIDRIKTDLKMIYEEKGSYLIEYQVKDRYGSIFWVEAIGKKTIYEGKEVDLVCLRDISERKLTEENMKNLLGKTKKLLDETVMVLSKTISEKDTYTSEHQKRVARLALAISKEMGLSKDIKEGIRISSILHDIGKIYIPGEILTAPRKLTDLEMALVRCHPVKGSEILTDVEFPWPVAKIILQHHERLNGQGYPKGLTAEKILLESKILAVSDVVEAMSAYRPYRNLLGVPSALAEIKKFKGVLYDPEVVDACLRVFKKGFTF